MIGLPISPPDPGDQLCAVCDWSNLDAPQSPYAAPCNTSIGGVMEICAGCCVDSASPCIECLHDLKVAS